MSWVIFVLDATLIWSVGSIISKFCRVSYIENSLGYLIFIAPTVLIVPLLLLFEPFVLLKSTEAFLAVLSGMIVTVGYYLYLEAIHKEELSKVFILFGTGPLFILVLSTIILKEVLTIKQYIAFASIFIGSTLVSLKKVDQKIKLTFGAILVLLSALFFAIHNVILKYISEINLTTLMLYRESGFLMPILFIFILSPKARKHAKKVINDLNIKKTALVYSAEVLGITGMFLVYLAIQRGPVSLVTVLEGFETIFIFILAIIISLYFPKILKEKIDKKTIIIKIISITLMLGGLYLI